MGALNVIHQVGPAIGYAVWIADVAKGFLAVLIAQWLGLSVVWVLIAGFVAVVGHNWPLFLGFRGGKGAATVMGVLLALMPIEFAISFVIIVMVVLITSNPVLGLIIGLVSLPLIVWQFSGSGILIVYVLALSAFLGVRYALAASKRVKDGTDIKNGLILNTEYHFWQAKKR